LDDLHTPRWDTERYYHTLSGDKKHKLTLTYIYISLSLVSGHVDKILS